MSATTPADIIVGVDTHKHVHAAVAVNAFGARLDTMTIPASAKGYRTLEGNRGRFPGNQAIAAA